jgi:hypothetical protein
LVISQRTNVEPIYLTIAKLHGWEWVAEVFSKAMSSMPVPKTPLTYNFQARKALVSSHYLHAEDTSLAHLVINCKMPKLASEYRRNVVLVFFQDRDCWIRCGILESGGLNQTFVKERIVRACGGTPLVVFADSQLCTNAGIKVLMSGADQLVSCLESRNMLVLLKSFADTTPLCR